MIGLSIFATLLVGVFIGVAVMCMLRMASDDVIPQSQLVKDALADKARVDFLEETGYATGRSVLSGDFSVFATENPAVFARTFRAAVDGARMNFNPAARRNT